MKGREDDVKTPVKDRVKTSVKNDVKRVVKDRMKYFSGRGGQAGNGHRRKQEAPHRRDGARELRARPVLPTFHAGVFP